MAASWPVSFADVAMRAFSPFALVDGPAPAVRTEWQFRYDRPGTVLEVRAMFTGILSWDSAGSFLRLESLNYPSEILNLVDEEWPPWMPIARVLEYRQLEMAAVHEAVTLLVAGLSVTERALIDAKVPAVAGLNDFGVASIFLGPPGPALSTPLVLPVVQGARLGSGAVVGTSREFALRGRDRASSTFFVNLAYHAAKLRQIGHLPDPPVAMAGGGPATEIRAALVDATGPMIGTGTVRTVGAANASHPGVRAAVQAAAPGDLVLITDAGTYSTPTTITIDKPIVITSRSNVDARTTGAGLPILRGVKPADPRNRNDWITTARRVLEVVGRRNGQPTFTGGVVQLSNFLVDSGASSHGGGLWVDECHQVVVDNVRFTNNEAVGGGWLFEGFGGGIGTRHAGIAVRRCAFLGNSANCRGGGMGVFGYGWPIVTDCVFESNRSARLGVQNPDSGRPFQARPDGGGMGIQMATPNVEPLYAEVARFVQRNQGRNQAAVMLDAASLSSAAHALFLAIAVGNMAQYWDEPSLTQSRRNAAVINRCRFFANTSVDDGGGIYMTGLVRARLRDCTFDSNTADTNGGGLRISTACDAVVSSSTFINNHSNARLRGYECEQERGSGPWGWEWTRSGGGAIASRTSNLKLIGVTVSGNRANRYAGGGVFFTSTDDGGFPGFPWAANDWNDVRDILVRSGNAPAPEFRQFSLVIDGGAIRDNACGWTLTTSSPSAPAAAANCGAAPTDWNTRDQRHAKGGGVYALRNVEGSDVYPPIVVSITAGTTLTGNVAAFSPTATQLFIADLNAAAAVQNPAADTSALALDGNGAVTTAYRFTATP